MVVAAAAGGAGGRLAGDRGLVERTGTGHDLSVDGLTPKLFLPGLSGLMQGPGFPNLSCLGLLSDRVLGARYPRGEGDRLTRRSDEHQPVR